MMGKGWSEWGRRPLWTCWPPTTHWGSSCSWLWRGRPDQYIGRDFLNGATALLTDGDQPNREDASHQRLKWHNSTDSLLGPPTSYIWYARQASTPDTSNMEFPIISVSSILKEVLSSFWGKKNCLTVSEWSRQKGLQCACESYVHNIACCQSVVNEDNVKIKLQAPHVFTIHI